MEPQAFKLRLQHLNDAAVIAVEALRDANDSVRRNAAGALTVVCRNRSKKWNLSFKEEIAKVLQAAMLEEKEDSSSLFWVEETLYRHAYDAMWEALWLVT
jgi:hypothetical protein